jgi:hypothetical protein
VVDHGGEVISRVNRQSGLVLGVWQSSTANGAHLPMDPGAGANQQFQLQRIQLTKGVA